MSELSISYILFPGQWAGNGEQGVIWDAAICLGLNPIKGDFFYSADTALWWIKSGTADRTSTPTTAGWAIRAAWGCQWPCWLYFLHQSRPAQCGSQTPPAGDINYQICWWCLQHRCVSELQASPGSHLHPGLGMWVGLGSWPGPAAPANELHLCPGAPPSSLCRNPTNISWRLKQINISLVPFYQYYGTKSAPMLHIVFFLSC